MAKESAGLLLYRQREGTLEFLLVHPGGPLWKHKDLGAWTIPKGEIHPGEDPLLTAKREVQEELGFSPQGDFIPLGSIKQRAGKIVHAWAIQQDWDPRKLKSNTFSVEWPPRSNRRQEFPEVDQAAFFDMAVARLKINPAQIAFLEALTQKCLLKIV
jgi:predicted NUDIX family NTP pyrophosphohydrolase